MVLIKQNLTVGVCRININFIFRRKIDRFINMFYVQIMIKWT